MPDCRAGAWVRERVAGGSHLPFWSAILAAPPPRGRGVWPNTSVIGSSPELFEGGAGPRAGFGGGRSAALAVASSSCSSSS